MTVFQFEIKFPSDCLPKGLIYENSVLVLVRDWCQISNKLWAELARHADFDMVRRYFLHSDNIICQKLTHFFSIKRKDSFHKWAIPQGWIFLNEANWSLSADTTSKSRLGWAYFHIKTMFPSIRFCIVKIRQLRDHLNGNFYMGKMAYFYWDGPLVTERLTHLHTFQKKCFILFIDVHSRLDISNSPMVWGK